VKSTFSREDREIIKLLEGLKSAKSDYPPKLLARRRTAFIKQVVEWENIEVKETTSVPDRKVTRLLKGLQSESIVYPPKLLAKQRAAFIKQVAKWENIEVKETTSVPDRKVTRLLKGLQSKPIVYPPKLLAKQRAAFINHLAEWERVEARSKLPLQNQDVIKLLENLKPIQAEYPRELLAGRRSAFVSQILQRDKTDWWERLRAGIQNTLTSLTIPQRITKLEFMRTTFVMGSLIAAMFLGSLLFGNHERLATEINNSSAQEEIANPIFPTPTSTFELAATICKPGYLPPMCLAKRFDKSRDLTFQGNGLARAAVAKDTLPGYSGIHQASYINDGLYGSGASWVSFSANSWIKIDLGQTTVINLVKFGKDRLGYSDNHNPGQFTIEVALNDNVYANGDSTNDSNEYQRVYDSQEAGFTGVVFGSETVQASFKPTLARFVKITVTNPGAAIDEVEVLYSDQISVGVPIQNTKEPRSLQATATVTSSPTTRPTNTYTPIPTNTPTPIPTDTATPIPTDTPTPIPTNTPTPVPSNTPTPVPTDTPLPLPTDTLIPLPTDTPLPLPTDTLIPLPTDTPMPISTDTPVPVPTI